mgnify:CR=1 FL=1
MAWVIEVDNKLRPCEVRINRRTILKGLFHGWFNVREFDGYSKEIVEKPIGVVELETGCVAKVDPGCIKFLDNPKYNWLDKNIDDVIGKIKNYLITTEIVTI